MTPGGVRCPGSARATKGGQCSVCYGWPDLDARGRALTHDPHFPPAPAAEPAEPLSGPVRPVAGESRPLGPPEAEAGGNGHEAAAAATIDRGAQIRAGIAAARARGVRFGSPVRASRLAEDHVSELAGRGLGLRLIARELDAAGVAAPRGGSWSPSTVRRVLARGRRGTD